MFYPNGGVCQFKETSGGHELVLIFPLFSDEKTMLALPVSPSKAAATIPFLVEDRLMYILYQQMFRIPKNKLGVCIGVMDSSAVNALVEGVSSALRGELLTVAVPSAIIPHNPIAAPENQEGISCFGSTEAVEVCEDATDETASVEGVAEKFKYSYEDYVYIMNNYQDNLDEVLRKYEIKDRKALYRVRYNLGKRFGQANEIAIESDHAAAGEPEGEL